MAVVCALIIAAVTFVICMAGLSDTIVFLPEIHYTKNKISVVDFYIWIKVSKAPESYETKEKKIWKL